MAETTVSSNNSIPIKKRIVHRRRSIIREFSLNTSTHGIPGIARSESIHNRIFWSVALLIFTGIMFYFIIQAIRAYFNYPTQTTITISSERLQNFPAFTFCNGGGIRHDKFIEAFLSYANQRNLTNIGDINSFTEIQAQFFRSYFPILLNQGGSVDYYTYTLDSMLVDCQYAEIPCSANDFTSFYSAVYGRCFTFNAKTKNNTLYYDYPTSGIGTLQLRLYLHIQEYVPIRSEGKIDTCNSHLVPSK